MEVNGVELHVEVDGDTDRPTVVLVNGAGCTAAGQALAGFADARLEVLPMTGHGSVLQRPALAVEVVAPFLRG